MLEQASTIKRLRKLRGLTQGDLAQLIAENTDLETTTATISRIERGDRQLTAKWIKAFSQALEVDEYTIITGKADIPESTGESSGIPVAGRLSAETWSSSKASKSAFKTVPVIPTDEYRDYSHSAFELEENSGVEELTNGCAITVPYYDARVNPTPGDLVVVRFTQGAQPERIYRTCAGELIRDRLTNTVQLSVAGVLYEVEKADLLGKITAIYRQV